VIASSSTESGGGGGGGGGVIPIIRAHRERDTTSYVGMVVFVASWAMLFSALFMSYAVLRLRSPSWPPPGVDRLPLGLPLVATAVLAASSGALQRGLGRIRRAEPRQYFRHLVCAIVLGLLFLAVQASVWWSLWQGGLTVRSGLYGGVFYLLTCFHAIHVLVGIFFLGWLVPAAAKNRDLGGSLGRIGVITLYWHFVGVVWAVMFVAVYLI
jgi:heme/copper-type cytochrome/quinol oxidase subunit 3